MHTTTIITGILLACLSAMGAAESRTQQKSKQQERESAMGCPNILFILLDDMGWRDPGFMGSDFYETPHMDALAAAGMQFSNAYACPNCAPTRASLMSGCYTPRHGVYTVGSSERGKSEYRRLIPTPNTTELSTTLPTMGELLRQAGYRTCHAGKWHLGHSSETMPEARGFDANIGGCGHGLPPQGYFAPFGLPNLEHCPEGQHLCDAVTDGVIDWIGSGGEQPFFVYCAFYDVHTPLQAKPELIAKYEEKRARLQAAGQDLLHDHPVYAAMVETADANIGRLLQHLDAQGLAEDTLVVVFSDNGGFGDVTRHTPLRGAKGMLYEGGIREPLVCRWPGHIASGSHSAVPVSCVDFLPTVQAVAGAEVPELCDGVSLLPILTGSGTIPERDLFWHVPVYLQNPGRHSGDSREGIWRVSPAGAIRSGRFKLIEWFDDGGLELYDLENDIGEQHNLADEQPELVRSLQQRLQAWRRETGAPVPDQANPKFDPDAFAAAVAAAR